jgi:hypothetical protein
VCVRVVRECVRESERVVWVDGCGEVCTKGETTLERCRRSKGKRREKVRSHNNWTGRECRGSEWEKSKQVTIAAAEQSEW